MAQHFHAVDELSPMKLPSPARGLQINGSSKDKQGLPLTAWPAEWHQRTTPTQLDMGVAEEDKEPAAKRAKTTCEPQGSESDTEELCMDENSTFLEVMRSLNQVVEESSSSVGLYSLKRGRQHIL